MACFDCWIAEALSEHQYIGLLRVLRWRWFSGFLFSVLKREYIPRKCFQLVLEMQLNAFYAQNHHLLRFKLFYWSCLPRKQSELFHFLLVVSAMRSLVRISVVLLLHILSLYHISADNWRNEPSCWGYQWKRAYNENKYRLKRFII